MSTTPSASSFSPSGFSSQSQSSTSEQDLPNRVNSLAIPIVNEPPLKRAKVESFDFSRSYFPFETPGGGALRPPPTPRRNIISSRPQPKAYTRAKEYAELSLEGVFSKLKEDYPDVKISEWEYIGRGDVFTAYRVNWNGSLQVVAIPHFQKIKGPKPFVRAMHGEVNNYYKLKENNFPVVDVFNFEPGYKEVSYLQDCYEGFRRSPYVPYAFINNEELRDLEFKMSEISGDELQKYEKTLQEENSPIYQLKEMFRLAYQKGIPTDLKWDNIGIQEDGTVVLFDLYYDGENDFEGENPFHCLVAQKLRTFAREGSPLWKYLDPRPVI